MNKIIFFLVFTISFCAFSPRTFAQVKAFPSAQGFGKFSTGGRYGNVIKVTNLNDSGIGSFRAACESSGHRIVVFEVGGRINLSSTIHISNPNITIAGQTSLGGGITLSVEGHPNTPVMDIHADNVIMRYISIRNTSTVVSSTNSDGLRISGGNNIIVDHCSFSWSSDENLGIYNYNSNGTSLTQNVTIQNCISANGYNGSSKGAINAGRYDKISYYQNAFISNNQRNPLFGNDTANTNQNDSYVEIVNNFVYNYKFANQISVEWANRGTPHANYVKNIGVQPNGVGVTRRFIYMASTYDIQVYTQGNIDQKRPTDNLDEWESTQGFGGAGDIDVLGNTSYQSNNPFSTQIINDGITLYDANNIWSNIKDHVGNSYPERDSFDILLINDVDNGTVSSSNTSAVGGFPTLANGTPLTDSDNDGIPDNVEDAVGLDKNDSADGALIHASGGSNLEYHYLWKVDGEVTPPTPDTNAPTDPTNITTTNINNTTATVTWNASTDDVGVSGYYIKNGVATISTVTGGESYNFTNLSPDTTYFFFVSAFDAAGNESSEVQISFTTTNSASAPTTDGKGVRVKNLIFIGQ